MTYLDRSSSGQDTTTTNITVEEALLSYFHGVAKTMESVSRYIRAFGTGSSTGMFCLISFHPEAIEI